MNIFAIEPLTLMISSRCNDKVEYQSKQQSLSIVRKAMKNEPPRLFRRLFSVSWSDPGITDTSGLFCMSAETRPCSSNSVAAHIFYSIK